ncbi:MAG: site-2 protease family protein [bacterium]|nr:site-2 protease family protein [bacterium]
MQGLDIIFSIIGLVLSIVVHEVSHGYAALYLGDPTAKLSGRLTLNPLLHLDPFGSVILPLMLIIFNAPFLLAWAKPVPYNPYNLSKGKWGPAIVAVAGPLSNFTIALVLSIFVRLDAIPLAALSFVVTIVIINIVLGIFNLLPFVPLDGSKILFSLLPYRLRHVEEFMYRYQWVLILFLFIFAWGPLVRIVLPAISYLFLGFNVF